MRFRKGRANPVGLVALAGLGWRTGLSCSLAGTTWVGCLGWLALAWQAGPDAMLPAMANQRLWVLAIGPFFAALAGIGFKEFFCFRRAEAIGITLLLPLALLGYWVGLLSPLLCLQILGFETALMLVLCLRKFPMPAAADVGDKSVFAHLKAQQEATH